MAADGAPHARRRALGATRQQLRHRAQVLHTRDLDQRRRVVVLDHEVAMAWRRWRRWRRRRLGRFPEGTPRRRLDGPLGRPAPQLEGAGRVRRDRLGPLGEGDRG